MWPPAVNITRGRVALSPAGPARSIGHLPPRGVATCHLCTRFIPSILLDAFRSHLGRAQTALRAPERALSRFFLQNVTTSRAHRATPYRTLPATNAERGRQKVHVIQQS